MATLLAFMAAPIPPGRDAALGIFASHQMSQDLLRSRISGFLNLPRLTHPSDRRESAAR